MQAPEERADERRGRRAPLERGADLRHRVRRELPQHENGMGMGLNYCVMKRVMSRVIEYEL